MSWLQFGKQTSYARAREIPAWFDYACWFVSVRWSIARRESPQKGHDARDDRSGVWENTQHETRDERQRICCRARNGNTTCVGHGVGWTERNANAAQSMRDATKCASISGVGVRLLPPPHNVKLMRFSNYSSTARASLCVFGLRCCWVCLSCRHTLLNRTQESPLTPTKRHRFHYLTLYLFQLAVMHMHHAMRCAKAFARNVQSK